MVGFPGAGMDIVTQQQTSLPQRLGEARSRIPDSVLHAARLHFLDALAVGMVGSRSGPIRHIDALAANDPGGPSSVLGSSKSVASPVAALINGALIHSLEFDDTHVSSVMHGSSVLAASSLAVSEQVGATGREALTAYAIGWEFLIRIGLASPGRVQARGFQITSTAGAFAAAAVSSLLHGDSNDVLGNAIGIAGSQAAGTFAFLANGDTVKAVQPGWAAHAGLMAAELARAGVTGPRDVFDGTYGFFSLYADDPDGGHRLSAEVTDLGDVWHLPEAAFKVLPCCHYIHPFVEAIHALMAGGVSDENLVGLHCWVPTEVVPIIAEPWPERKRPVKPHDARWSLPYVLASVLLNGDLNPSIFDGTCDERVMKISDRFTYESWSDSGFPLRYPARVRAQLLDGSVREAVIDDVKGSSTRPVHDSDVLDKATTNLIASGIDRDEAQTLVTEILSEPNPDLAVIGRILRREPGS